MSPHAHELPCGRCGGPLGPSPIPRRNVPERGGRRLAVCPSCARSIDEQLELELGAAGAPGRHHGLGRRLLRTPAQDWPE